MTRLHCMAAAIVIAFAVFNPAHAIEPTGIWLIQDGTAKVRLVACGEAICGNVVWLSEPIDPETGKPKLDKLNGDPQLRSRPIMGIGIVLGMQRRGEENKWAGRLYNPDDGNTYRGSVEIIDATRLKVQGCVSVYCQSEVWTRAN